MKSNNPFAPLVDDLSSAGSSLTAVRPPSPFGTGHLLGGWPSSPRADTSRLLAEPSHPISCVTRETFPEDCARHRFIVWAAVKRNSSSRMSAEKRLECPLLRCTQRFLSHEMMLRHLAGCEFLSSGEYWCYDHMRVERFDDVKCKHCLGHPSKRRKMLSMAKRFFHSLGHKHKKAPGFAFDPGDAASLPPPSYESLHISPQPADPTELSATEIVEIDSNPVTVTATTLVPNYDGAIDPQALLIPELESNPLSSESFMQWQPAPGVIGSSMSVTPPEESELPSPVSRPFLQVNTHGLQGGRNVTRPRPAPRSVAPFPRSKDLSPSSSVRSNASTATTASNASSLVSPVSNWSGAWSMASGFDTSLTSPAELTNPDEFFSDNPLAGSYDASNTAYTGLLHDFCSELPADVPNLNGPENFSPEPLLFSFAGEPFANPSYATDVELMEDSIDLLGLDDAETGESSSCCSETKSLVGSAWDALQEHIVSSMLKIDQTRGNPLADQLRSKSTRSIVTAGLQALRSLLGGNNSISAIDTLCLVHLVYAFSLVIHEQDTADRAKDLFFQSLSYAAHLGPGEQDLYTQLTCQIWQPASTTHEQINKHFSAGQNGALSRSSSLKGKAPEASAYFSGIVGTDPFLTAAFNFLDELESSVVLGQPPSSLTVQTSDLYAKHLDCNPHAGVNTPFSVTVNFVLAMLIRDFCDVKDLAPSLRGLHERVNNGVVSSVRRVELELLSAGKGCMSRSAFFGTFVPKVRRLCDQFYDQHDSGDSGRAVYHRLGTLLIESIIPEFDLCKAETPILDGASDLDDLLDAFTATHEQGHQAVTYPAMEPMAASPFGTIDPSNLDGTGTSDLQIPTITTTAPEESSSRISSAAPRPTQPQTEQATQQQQGQAQGQKAEADASCGICGYRPKGAPQWFKGSMAKHKKLQHSAEPPKIYRCQYPGCTSQYRNRPDNLRQHQIEKGHFVGEEVASRRPSKRKKTAEDDG